MTIQCTHGTRHDNHCLLVLYSMILCILSYSDHQSITRETEGHLFAIPLFFKHQTDHPGRLTARGLLYKYFL
jgi:hypothetical protein